VKGSGQFLDILSSYTGKFVGK